MKRKKWTEEEESTLIAKYSELMQSGTLPKLKTREKKFEPIAQHLNSLHHLQDPITFPFLWSWRDVSIKIQNMRHQYLGVKQKIRIPSSSPPQFNWPDGPSHWHNFLTYKNVFGDVDLDDEGAGGNLDPHHKNDPICSKNDEIAAAFDDAPLFDFAEDDDVLGLGLEMDSNNEEENDEVEENGEGAEKGGCDLGGEAEEERGRKRRRRREAEWEAEREQRAWVRREMESLWRTEREFEEGERRRRMRMEERREEEEMEWRERMVGMQVEHEKQMMQMHADACSGQMQVLGLLVRLVCQFFGSGGDGLGGGIGVIPSQVLHHPGSLVGDNGKADGSSDPHFM